MSSVTHIRSRRRSTLFVALALQAVVLVTSLFVIVKDDPPAEVKDFTGEIEVSSNETLERQNKVRDDFRRRMSQPRTFRPLAVDNALDPELPQAPAMPKSSFSASATDMFSQFDPSMVQGSLFDDLAPAGGRRSTTEFFGIKDSGERIVIVVNTSASVVRKARNRGVTIEELYGQAEELLSGLNSGTSFGIVQFSQGSRTFSDQLAPALSQNKQIARDWIGENLRGNPPVGDERLLGHEGGLVAALELRPDLIYLVTDGVFNKRVRSKGRFSYPTISAQMLLSTLDAACRRLGVNPKIHVIGFELGTEERSGLQRLARRFGGSLKEF